MASDIKGINRDLGLVALSLGIWGIGESAFFSFQSLYLQQLGANPVMIGAFIGIYGLAGIIAHIPAGFLADRIGRKPLMVTGWIVGIIATLLMGLAANLTIFVLAMTLYAITVFVSAPMSSYITAARGKWSVERALTTTSAVYYLGAIFGPLVGGAIGNRFSLRFVFLFSAVLYVASTVFIVNIHPQPVDTHQKGTQTTNSLFNPRFVGILATLLLATFAMYLPQPLVANYLQSQQRLSLLQIGQLYSINAIGIVILSLVLGRTEARYGYLIAQAFVCGYALILWKSTGMPWFVLAFLLLGGFRPARSLGAALIRPLVPLPKMGLAYGMAETFCAAAIVLAPLLAGYLYEKSPVLVFSTAALMIGCSFLISFILTRTPSEQETFSPQTIE